jgi:hypothetical protein
MKRILASAFCSLTLVLSASPLFAADAKPASTSESPAETKLPAEVDLRPQFEDYGLGPRRQGRRNTCSVFTTVAAMEFALAKQSGKGEPLSVEYLNWACNQVINNKSQDRGQFFHHLLKAYDEYGICTESEMPYARRFAPELAPSDEAKQQAKEISDKGFKIHWIKRWRSGSGLNDKQFAQAKEVLASGLPVASGASHSRLLVGYSDDPEQPGGGIFYTKDSGSGKFSQVNYEFAKTKMNDAFWVELPANDAE